MGRSRRLPHASRKRKVRPPRQVEDQRVTAPAAPPQITFIPKRINNAREPGLHLFPLKILFGKPIWAEGEYRLAAALYEPHLPSFTIRKNQMTMWYYNAHECKTWWSKLMSPSRSCVGITCTEKADGGLNYIGEKFVNGKQVGSAAGYRPAADDEKGWHSFFFHLTILGISEGEPCVVHHSPGFPPRWPEHLGLPTEMTKDVMNFQVISPDVESETAAASPPKALAPSVKPESGVLVWPTSPPSREMTMKERYHYMTIALTLLDDDPEISGRAADYAAKHWAEGCDPVLDAFIGQAFRGCGQDNPESNGSACSNE